MTRRLAFVSAHPDDDTYTVGGVLAGTPDLGYCAVVATSGEGGLIADPGLATRENLGAVREGEQREALRVLGVGDPVLHFLRFPDGGLEDVATGELEEQVAGPLREFRPEVVATFGPDGVTGHPDHIAVSSAATGAFHRLRAEVGESGRAFRRLLYCALPQSSLDRLWNTIRAWGLEFGQPDDPFTPRGVADDSISVRVDCRDVIARKVEAIKAHRTQLEEFTALPEDVQRPYLQKECFVQAWPPAGETPGPVAGGPFEGLE